MGFRRFRCTAGSCSAELDVHTRRGDERLLAPIRQRSLSEQFGHVLPHAQQQARTFHIGLRNERGFAHGLAV